MEGVCERMGVVCVRVVLCRFGDGVFDLRDHGDLDRVGFRRSVNVLGVVVRFDA